MELTYEEKVAVELIEKFGRKDLTKEELRRLEHLRPLCDWDRVEKALSKIIDATEPQPRAEVQSCET